MLCFFPQSDVFLPPGSFNNAVSAIEERVQLPALNHESTTQERLSKRLSSVFYSGMAISPSLDLELGMGEARREVTKAKFQSAETLVQRLTQDF